MDKFVVNGGKPLTGEVDICGAKNAAVAIIPATILADSPCRLENIPNISDVTAMFEILKQAGLRMPQSVGQALGIVGCLVVGQAAVEARIISAPMLIAVSFGSIAGLVVPQLQGVVFYVRLLSVVVAAFLGVFGLILLYFLLCIRLFSINSFGADYTEGIGEATFQSLKDTIIRASWRDMIKRPIFNRNIIRNGGYRRW